MTPEQKVYIIEHRLKLRSKAIADKIGVSKAVVTEYMRIYEIKPDKKIINRWKSESMQKTLAKRKKNKSWDSTPEQMIAFAKNIGYRNSAEAIGALGRVEFKRQFKESLHKENCK